MKKTVNVIDPKCFPSNPIRPAWTAMVVFLMLDRFAAPGWLQGVVWTVFILAWIGIIGKWAREQNKPVFGFGEIEDKKS